MQKWEIWRAKVWFEDKPDCKIRPVLVLGGVVYIVSAPITKHEPREEFDGEYPLINWEKYGLDYPSTIRLSKQVKIPEKDFIDCLATLDKQDIVSIANILNRMKQAVKKNQK